MSAYGWNPYHVRGPVRSKRRDASRSSIETSAVPTWSSPKVTSSCSARLSATVDVSL